MEELSGRGARGTLGEQKFVDRILIREGGQPDYRKDRRSARHHRRLQEREPDMTQRAAVLGRVMMIVLESGGRELRGGERAEHQDDE